MFVALVSADVTVSVLQLFTGAQLLPRFVVFVSSAVLVPVFMLVSLLSGENERRRASLDRVAAVVAGEEAERLARDMKERTERPAQLVVRGPTRRGNANL